MPRNLIVCCDGTNNQFGRENTSVVRMVQVLDRHPDRQIIYYDPGVGTLPEPGLLARVTKKLDKWIDLAFGTGLRRNVEEAYSYLMQTWEPGDRVFLFGFSRGAYTARVLAAVLHGMGLLPRGSFNLLPYLMRLFEAIRESGEGDGGRSKSAYWALCEEFRWTFARPVPGDDGQRHFPVHFLGAWDTVSSVGWVWEQARYPFSAKNPSVRTVRHAVSVDERRWFFRQNLFHPADSQDLVELWFPGVHSDVGGGYPETEGGLWRPPFEWMLDEARPAGLLVDQERLRRILDRTRPPERAWTEPQHESLTLAWWPAELFPKLQWRARLGRRVPQLGLGRRRHIAAGALIHRSALLRIRETAYAPRNMAQAFLDEVRRLGTPPSSLAYRATPMAPLTEAPPASRAG